MRRLYQKIYLTIIASLLLVVLVAGGVWRWGGGPPGPQVFEMAGELASMALPPADAPRGEGGWAMGMGGPAWSFRLPDDRWIAVRAPGRHRHPAIGLVLFLGGIALAVALAAYPVVRGLTRRLERLQAGVDTLGAGNLAARVKVEGKDEVARLAESFNRAAARIEELMGAHRMLLARSEEHTSE